MLKQFYEKALTSQGVYCVSGIEQTTKKTVNRFAETLEDVFKLVPICVKIPLLFTLPNLLPATTYNTSA